VQVVLCSQCDRGNRYCSRPCWRLSRDAARRDAGRRYQSSRRGRLAHAERSRRWRQRRAAGGVSDGHGRGVDDAENVTHQGSQPGVAAAPLVAWTQDAASSSLGTTTVVPGEHDIAPAAPWTCRRCAAAQPALVRQGFLRHGPHHRQRLAHRGWRHDHSP
jgi:hypothetical protein